jgi:hypothetical protein
MNRTYYNLLDEQTKNQDNFSLSRSNFRTNPFLKPDNEDVISNFSYDSVKSIEKCYDYDFSMHVSENPSPVLPGFDIDSPCKHVAPTNEEPFVTEPLTL